jgi:putative intracellular protease/amidase
MRLSILLFDGFTALDVVGGYEVLVHVPGLEVEFAAERPGLVAADSRRLGLAAYRTFDGLESTDILYVPGGPGVEAALQSRPLLDCIRRLHQTSTWTVSVCNGALLLGGAGLLRGREATTNYFDRERVASFGAIVRPNRFHQDGKLITGAGVSASIDTGLFLASLLGGPDLARTIQLGIEYYPQPPLGNGTADEQPEALKDIIRRVESTSAQRLASLSTPF